jgi:sigma-E factor negative regulatory protein RseB
MSSSKSTPYQSLLLFLSLTLPVAAFATQLEEVQSWLEKMQRAAHTVNYEGTFVYGQQGRLSSMRIIHRVTSEGEQERLISMDGTGREVIRDHGKVTCFLPDSNAVVVEKSRPVKHFPPEFPMKIDDLKDFYTFSLMDDSRVAGHLTQGIKILPKDPYRYGHHLWVEKKTGLLLKTHLLDEHNKPIEQFVFTQMTFLDQIPDEQLVPAMDTQQFTWYEAKEGDEKSDKAEPDMHVAWLPGGFKEDMKRMQKLPTGGMPVKHMVFSDGLSSVSVFIEEDVHQDPGNLVGGSRMGAINAHGRSLGDYHVTVVGEVPHITVEKICEAITPTNQ